MANVDADETRTALFLQMVQLCSRQFADTSCDYQNSFGLLWSAFGTDVTRKQCLRKRAGVYRYNFNPGLDDGTSNDFDISIVCRVDYDNARTARNGVSKRTENGSCSFCDRRQRNNGSTAAQSVPRTRREDMSSLPVSEESVLAIVRAMGTALRSKYPPIVILPDAGRTERR